MLDIGTKIKTKCGLYNNPYWVYGTIFGSNIVDGCYLYDIKWDGDGYDQ